MIRNYIKIAIRNLLRFKVYSFVNLFGLALGLTLGVLILLFVTDELAYDRFHTRADRIFKVVSANPEGGTLETNAWPVAHKLRTEYPEVEAAVYTRRAAASMMVNYEGKRYEHDIFYAGEEFFRIFSFDLIEGDPETALEKPFSVVITQSMKERYFGLNTALGETLLIRDSLEFEVTGVVEDVSPQSHIQFDVLASFSTFEKLVEWFSYSEGWGNFNVRNYVLLSEGADIDDIRGKAASIYIDNVGDWLKEMGIEFYVDFIPLSDIYLRSDVPNGFGSKGSIDQVYLISAIGIFIILLACINFINLTTARSVYRAREVGLRKIVGSTRAALFWQFLAEAFLLTLLAFAVVAILIDFALPFFNELMGKSYILSSLFSTEMLISLIVLIVMVSALAGFYPALVLSGYKPVEVLKGRMQSGAKGVKLRRILVVFQFLISAGLVLSTLIVLDQLNYMQSQNLGFAKEQVLVLDATRVPRSASHTSFKNALQSLSGVENVSFTNALPGRPGWQGQWAYPGDRKEGQQVDTEYMAIDENYIDVLDLELVAGKNFDLNHTAELREGLIVNETTVKEMGWQTPVEAIGKKIESPSGQPEGTVIGVVKDYHGLGLQENIWPKAMDFTSQRHGRYYAIRFITGQTADLVESAKESWHDVLGDYGFEYFFLDVDFDRQYRAEERLIKVFTLFAALTLMIAGIGLLGLVSFLVLSRTREIGIRKVLGADVLNIAALLSREFMILVLLANLITIPLVWYYGDQWLSNFAYHTTIDPVIFLVTLGLTLLMAVVTVSIQTIKAGLANPVEALRSE